MASCHVCGTRAWSAHAARTRAPAGAVHKSGLVYQTRRGARDAVATSVNVRKAIGRVSKFGVVVHLYCSGGAVYSQGRRKTVEYQISTVFCRGLQGPRTAPL